MFENLAIFEKILVAGPQRSGTRICAKMIAEDTGLRFIDEKRISGTNVTALKRFLNSLESVVIQCPGLCYCVHEFSSPTTAIVLMRRAIVDILVSQERIKWGNGKDMLVFYGLQEGTISEIKYDFWDKKQKQFIDYPFEVWYESLSAHPLWVPKKKRKNFRWDQTALLEE